MEKFLHHKTSPASAAELVPSELLMDIRITATGFTPVVQPRGVVGGVGQTRDVCCYFSSTSRGPTGAAELFESMRPRWENVKVSAFALFTNPPASLLMSPSKGAALIFRI